jgi:hypothetical protein
MWYNHPLVQSNSTMKGILILAHQRMRMSVLMHRMQLAWKRLSGMMATFFYFSDFFQLFSKT